MAKSDDPYAFCESLASHFLQLSDFSASNVVSILDAFPSENNTRDWCTTAGNSKAITVGACNRGGVTSIRDNTKRMPSVAKFLCACIKRVAPACQFTSVSVHRNLQAPLHQDSFNSSVPNVVVPVSSFSGGEIFVVHPDGPSRQVHGGVAWQGFVLDCANQAWAFDAKHCKHFTLPWQQDRIIMIAFSVGHLSGLAQDAQDFLDSLGFQIPQGEAQHGPTMIPYAITDADLRCPQVATDSAPLHPVSPAFPHAELPGEGPLLIELCAGMHTTATPQSASLLTWI